MRRRRVFAGVLLVIPGVVLAVLALTVQFPEGTHSAATPWTVTPSSGLPVSATVAWKGATSATRVYVAQGAGDCNTLTSVVAQGSGSAGGLAVHLTPGTSYVIFACNDPAAPTTEFTLLAVGAQGYALPLGAGGGVLLIAGAALLVEGLRGRRRRTLPYARRHRGRFD